MIGILTTAATAIWQSRPIRWIVLTIGAAAAVAFILWRALSSAEHRGAMAQQAKTDRQTLRKITDATHAETDANSGSPRDRRLHDRFDRD